MRARSVNRALWPLSSSASLHASSTHQPHQQQHLATPPTSQRSPATSIPSTRRWHNLFTIQHDCPLQPHIDPRHSPFISSIDHHSLHLISFLHSCQQPATSLPPFAHSPAARPINHRHRRPTSTTTQSDTRRPAPYARPTTVAAHIAPRARPQQQQRSGANGSSSSSTNSQQQQQTTTTLSSSTPRHHPATAAAAPLRPAAATAAAALSPQHATHSPRRSSLSPHWRDNAAAAHTVMLLTTTNKPTPTNRPPLHSRHRPPAALTICAALARAHAVIQTPAARPPA